MATIVELKGEHQDFKEDSETTDMALFVRTSDESMQGWDRRRIVDALVRETYVDLDTAQEIAREVEELISRSQIRMITAPLVRELVDAKLIEKGLEQARKMHTRLECHSTMWINSSFIPIKRTPMFPTVLRRRISRWPKE